MPETRTPNLPIGYWIKRADELLTSRINQIQEAHGLTRSEWQVLNVLRELGSPLRDEVAEPMRPFLDEESLGRVLARLTERELVERDGAADVRLRLSEPGRQLHEAALRTQIEVRRRAVREVSETEYLTAVRVLQRMIENLTEEEAIAGAAPALAR